jgi:hypothetical protein
MTRIALVALLVALAIRDARADDALAKARAAIDELDYSAAQVELESALRKGDNSPEQLLDVYRLTGIVAASLGDTKAAVAAFERLLSISPKATLPPGTSPKISKPFATALGKAKDRPGLSVKPESASEPPSLTLVVENDSLGLVVRGRATFVVDGGKEQTLEADGKDRITIKLPIGARIDVRAVALDQFGNRIVEIGSKEVPIVINGKAPEIVKTPKVTKAAAPRPPRSPRSWYFKWYLWTSVAVLSATGATYFGIEARSGARDLDVLFENSVNHRAGESVALEDRVRRDVLFTNITLGATAVFGLGAAILYLTEPRSEAHPKTVTVVPVEAGGAVVVGGRF